MAEIKLKGNSIHTNGNPFSVGARAPNFVLVDADLQEVKLEQFSGEKIFLYTAPSLDTEVCATSTKKINDFAKSHAGAFFLVITADLPFAQKRFCTQNKVDNVKTLSTMRNQNFGKDYGILIVDGPLSGVLARSLLVLDEQHKIIYSELVPEITQEPNYESAFKALI